MDAELGSVSPILIYSKLSGSFWKFILELKVESLLADHDLEMGSALVYRSRDSVRKLALLQLDYIRCPKENTMDDYSHPFFIPFLSKQKLSIMLQGNSICAVCCGETVGKLSVCV